MSASSAFNCRARDFARRHSRLAENVLTPTKYLGNNNNDLKRFESLEDYLYARQWFLDDVPENHIDAARDLLSHTLSYPLTLTLFARQLLKDSKLNYKEEIRICCIGARAEATLPRQFWREFLIAVKMCNEINVSCPNKWIIDFVGPETTMRKKSDHIFANDGLPASGANLELQLMFSNGYLQDRNKDEADGYVMFNPGLGHPHLKDGWSDTLDNLLIGNPIRRKPMFMTAHSDKDRDRDLTIVKDSFQRHGISIQNEISSSMSKHDLNLNYSYQPCTFASRMGAQDPFSSSEVVYANSHYFYLPGSD